MKQHPLVAGILAAALCAAVGLVHCCKGNDNSNGAAAATGFSFREKLSDYGIFQGKLNELQPVAGVIHYELATPLFTDYALKDRMIILPPGQQMKYAASGPLDFPDSTIILKHFSYRDTSGNKVLIETRMLFRDPADHNWKVMNYLWNGDQTDAVKHITGAKIPLTLLDDEGNRHSTVYMVPNTNDCKRCHVSNSILTPVGPKASNLNLVHSGMQQNQLIQWAAEGKLSGLPGIQDVPVMPAWNDAQQGSLEQRARAYIDVNCAHCHRRGGDAENTGLYLEYEQTDPDHLGIMKEPVSAGAGAGGLNYDIIPGNAQHSIFVYRMNSTEPGTAMPELARTLIHAEGVQLVTAWINAMQQRKN